MMRCVRWVARTNSERAAQASARGSWVVLRRMGQSLKVHPRKAPDTDQIGPYGQTRWVPEGQVTEEYEAQPALLRWRCWIVLPDAEELLGINIGGQHLAALIAASTTQNL